MAQAATALARLAIVREIQEDEQGATLHFQQGGQGRLDINDANYSAHMRLARRSHERQHPLGIRFGEGQTIAELIRADNDVPTQLFPEDAAGVRVFFQGHDGVFRLKADHPDYARLRALLDEVIRQKARAWFIVQKPDLAFLDILPAEWPISNGDPQAYNPESEAERELLQGLIDFHSNEASALLSRYGHIEKLLSPGHHSASEGDFCEDLVRQFLRQVLPSRYSIGHGFIRHTPRRRFSLPTHVSKQLDVIIHNSHDYAPVFSSGEFVIVLPQAVEAVIEVKKTLDSGEIKDALEKLAQANEVLVAGRRDMLQKTFSGIFAFTEAKEMQVTTKGFSDSYRSRMLEACQKRAAGCAIPDAIVVTGRHLFYREVDPVCNGLDHHRVMRRTVIHNRQDVSVQGFLNVLFNKIRLPEMSDASGRFIFPSALSEEQVAVFAGEEQVWPPA